MIGHQTLIIEDTDHVSVRDKSGKPGLTICIGLEATVSMSTAVEIELFNMLYARQAARHPHLKLV